MATEIAPQDAKEIAHYIRLLMLKKRYEIWKLREELKRDTWKLLLNKEE